MSSLFDIAAFVWLLAWSAIVTPLAVILPSLACAYLQVQAVERARPWLYEAGQFLAGVLNVAVPLGALVLTSEFTAMTVPASVALLIMAGSAFIVAYGPGSAEYARSRELYVLHDDPDEDWTSAYARGEHLGSGTDE